MRVIIQTLRTHVSRKQTYSMLSTEDIVTLALDASQTDLLTQHQNKETRVNHRQHTHATIKGTTQGDSLTLRLHSKHRVLINCGGRLPLSNRCMACTTRPAARNLLLPRSRLTATGATAGAATVFSGRQHESSTMAAAQHTCSEDDNKGVNETHLLRPLVCSCDSTCYTCLQTLQICVTERNTHQQEDRSNVDQACARTHRSRICRCKALQVEPSRLLQGPGCTKHTEDRLNQ